MGDYKWQSATAPYLGVARREYLRWKEWKIAPDESKALEVSGFAKIYQELAEALHAEERRAADTFLLSSVGLASASGSPNQRSPRHMFGDGNDAVGPAPASSSSGATAASSSRSALHQPTYGSHSLTSRGLLAEVTRMNQHTDSVESPFCKMVLRRLKKADTKEKVLGVAKLLRNAYQGDPGFLEKWASACEHAESMFSTGVLFDALSSYMMGADIEMPDPEELHKPDTPAPPVVYSEPRRRLNEFIAQSSSNSSSSSSSSSSSQSVSSGSLLDADADVSMRTPSPTRYAVLDYVRMRLPLVVIVFLLIGD